MRSNSRTGWAGVRVAGMAAFVAVLAAGVRIGLAESPGPSAPGQPAVTLPHADILGSGHVIGATQPAAVPESEREIHRPAEPAGGAMEKKSSPAALPAGVEDGRSISRQGPARGLWRVGDFLPLAVVLALVAAAAWAVKRYLPARRLATGSGVLEIVARLPIGPKQSLALVKMGRRMILVGISPERVSTLCLVDDPEQVAELIGRMAAQSRDSADRAFGRSLDHQADEFGQEADEEPPLRAAGGVRGLLEKVRRLSRTGVS